jgi:hypothetical protein
MDRKHTKAKATEFVRRYSTKAAEDMPNNELAQALGHVEEINRASEFMKEREVSEWQKWLRFEKIDECVNPPFPYFIQDSLSKMVRTSDVALLEKECKELIEVWADFQSHLPKADQQLPLNQDLLNIGTVKKAVEAVAQDWEAKKESKFGKAKDYLFKFCDTLVAHSELFSIFPQGDKYTSLFTGVLSSIVKVSSSSLFCTMADTS